MLTASTVHASTLRHLRLAVNAFLEDTALIVRTIDSFAPPQASVAGGAPSVQHQKHLRPDSRLETGSVGRTT